MDHFLLKAVPSSELDLKISMAPRSCADPDAVIVEKFEYTGGLFPEYPRTAAGFATDYGKVSYATVSTRSDQACAQNRASQLRADNGDEQNHIELADALRSLRNPLPLKFP